MPAGPPGKFDVVSAALALHNAAYADVTVLESASVPAGVTWLQETLVVSPAGPKPLQNGIEELPDLKRLPGCRRNSSDQ